MSSSWFAKNTSDRRSPSPRLSPGPKIGVLNSRSMEKPTSSRGTTEMKLECKVQGLYNPLAWDTMPSSIKEKFPHWKECSQSYTTNSSKHDEKMGYSIQCLKTSKQPAFTIPYVVMDHDTIQGIAVKFETTPSEIARINKKPTLTFSIFPGDVLYVPDQEELAKLVPPPERLSTPTSPTALTSSTATIVEEDEKKSNDLIKGVEQEADDLTTTGQAPESHISALSKYISEDHGCAHGNLVVNKMALMFTPNSQDPLVKEHGTCNYEIIIPLEDITLAAVSRSVTFPERRAPNLQLSINGERVKKCEASHVLGDGVERNEVDGVEGEGRGDDYDGGALSNCAPVDDGATPLVENGMIKLQANSCSKDHDNGEHPSFGDGKEVVIHNNIDTITNDDVIDNNGKVPPPIIALTPTLPDVEAQPVASQAEKNIPLQKNEAAPSSSADITPTKTSEIDASNSGVTNADEMLAIMGASETQDHEEGQKIHPSLSHNTSVCSSDSTTSLDILLAETPYFLHLRVSRKCGHTFTYTPINNTVGIDIPRRGSTDELGDTRIKSLSPPVVQQVKREFCFAVIENRLNELVEFICHHHKSSRPDLGPATSDEGWTDGSYEFINTEMYFSNEDLSISEDHFQSSSWEVYSLKDVIPRSRITKMDVEANLPLPNLSETSDLMTEVHIRKLMSHLPSRAIGHDWYLIYSTFKHGISLRTLYRNMFNFDNEETPIILLVKDGQNKLFGAALTCRIIISERYYGTGESFMFSFEESGELKVFPWSGINNYVVKGNNDSFSIGSGDGHPGLWLDESFYHGSSYNCSTFNNDCLASSEDFICTGVEAWGFV